MLPQTCGANSCLVRAKSGFYREVMCLQRNKKGRSIILSPEFCLFDSKAVWLHSSPKCSRVKMLPAQLLNQDLHFFFHYKHITSFKTRISLAQGESLSYWFRDNFCSRGCFDLLAEGKAFACNH